MLQISVPATTLYDEGKNEFLDIKQHTLQLEHSLVSISKWESEHNKPFISNLEKTTEETLSYIRCMTLTQNVDPNVYLAIPNDVIKKISDYINAPMTATTINGIQSRGPKEVVTSELVYFWMIAQNIPFECQKWHLNRLFTLIQVCSIKNSPDKKMSQKDIYARNRALNDARRKKLNTKG